MANVNRVILIGNLTRDPELRSLPSGASVCEFTLAINRNWAGKDGEKRDETCFIDIVAWARTGEVVAQYMRKGSPLYVEGRLTQDRWEAQDGTKRSKIKVTAERVQFVGGGRREEGGREAVPAAGEGADIPF